ncbi:MAG: endonuclease/exonuclease/phosphatase family protein [Bacteroides sp.]|nr:endonuclease/exonuclease/phosphatase family protein [Bacteroides sp.]
MKKHLFLLPCLCLLLCIGCAPKKHDLRIMSYNIRIGVGMDITTNLERPAEVIKRVNPDYVGLQEVDSVAERTDWVDQAAELGRLTGMHPIFAPAIERSKGLYGIAALVKEKPIAVRNIQLPGEEELRTFLVLEYPDYVLCNTHFSLRKPSRKESIEIIKNTLKEYDKPAIITGDFNMRPASEECRLMGEAWTLLSDSTQLTFPSDTPRVTLDYIWGHKGHEYQVKKYEVVQEPMASDHLPIYLDVVL